MIVRFNGIRKDLEEFVREDQEGLRELGMVIQEKKTIFSRHGVIAENYSHCDFSRKTGLNEARQDLLLGLATLHTPKR
jgi:hypothetical protein